MSQKALNCSSHAREGEREKTLVCVCYLMGGGANVKKKSMNPT